MFTSSTKRVIREFDVLAMQRRQRNVHKSVMHVQICCFAHPNLLFPCRFLCLEATAKRGGAKKNASKSMEQRAWSPLVNYPIHGNCTLGTRGFSRVQREFSVLVEGRHIFGRRPNSQSLWHPGYANCTLF